MLTAFSCVCWCYPAGAFAGLGLFVRFKMAYKTSRLDAVNTMLSAAGETPVSSLVDNAGVDVAMADQILTECERSVQAAGWRWNTRTAALPVVSNQIPLADSIIRVDMNDNGTTQYTIRNGYLFDLDANSKDFTQAVTAEIVELLDWDDLPEAARQYVMHKAARIFVSRTVTDQTLIAAATRDEGESLMKLEREEATTGNYRVFNQRDLLVVDRGGPLNTWSL